MTRRDNIPDGEPRASGWTCWSCWGSCHIEPRGSRTGNPFGDRVFLGAATAVAYKTESWSGCGRHLSPGMSSKVATDGPFEAVLGKTRRTEFSRGKGKPEARLSPPGAPSLLGSYVLASKPKTKPEPTLRMIVSVSLIARGTDDGKPEMSHLGHAGRCGVHFRLRVIDRPGTNRRS